MGEFEHIAWLRKQTPAHAGVLVGPGDDCAVLKLGPTLVTTDMLLEGSHFKLAEHGPRRIGRKAMAVNLSDIAAMGGRPIAAFVSVGLPQRNTESLAQDLYAGMREVANAFETAIAGGDTNTWPGSLAISVTLIGEPSPQGPILRSGAMPGDWLLVTGPLGGSILGKHLDFTPRIREALAMQQFASLHAMIDISDGLSADAYHLCEESGCGLVLHAKQIPISDAAQQLNDDKSPLEHALTDGEDFELAFAVSEADARRLLQSQPIAGIQLTHVGDFVAEQALFLHENGTMRPIEPLGFTHHFE
jgi:thiamine-monophosphate kinase